MTKIISHYNGTMKTKTRYRKNSRLDNSIQKKIIEYFSMDLTATQASELLSIERKTINDWYMYIRKAIAWHEECESWEKFSGEIEIDESYFWPTRVRWKRGRWAGMKTIVFGLLKRNGKVYTEIIPDCKAKTLKPIIRNKIELSSEINTDGWWAYDWLVDMGYEQHYRVHHGANEFARGKQHVNGIESFWSFTKRRFARLNGIQKKYFYYHLKESEFRYNCRIMKQDTNYIIQQILIEFTKQLL